MKLVLAAFCAILLVVGGGFAWLHLSHSADERRRSSLNEARQLETRAATPQIAAINLVQLALDRGVKNNSPLAGVMKSTAITSCVPNKSNPNLWIVTGVSGILLTPPQVTPPKGTSDPQEFKTVPGRPELVIANWEVTPRRDAKSGLWHSWGAKISFTKK